MSAVEDTAEPVSNSELDDAVYRLKLADARVQVAEAMRDEAAMERATAINILREIGMSYEGIGRILNVPKQRVHYLTGQ